VFSSLMSRLAMPICSSQQPHEQAHNALYSNPIVQLCAQNLQQ